MKPAKATQLLSLGEGNTPLFRLRALERTLSWRGQLWAKAEYQNPTGSFKDRGTLGEITEAIRAGKSGIICASTGNMAASVALYAARAHLSCFVVVPEQTPPGKVRQAGLAGASILPVKGSYDDCVARAGELAAKNNLYLAGDYETRRAAQRSIGTELTASAITFDAFVVPVGNGTVGCAVFEGFRSRGQTPAFIGVQADAANPVATAWRENRPITTMTPLPTAATAMAVGSPLDGALTLTYIRASNGVMISVSDREIIEGQRMLAANEGVYAETSASATAAALPRIPRRFTRLVLIITGTGLKEGGVIPA